MSMGLTLCHNGRAYAGADADSQEPSWKEGTALPLSEKPAQKSAAEYERERQELNHRVSNSLQLVASFLRLQQPKVKDVVAKKAILAASARIMGIATLHRYLYQHALDDVVDMAAFLQELCPQMSESLGLHCSLKAETAIVPGTTATQLAIVVNELVLNALKHAYDGEPGGQVSVACLHDGNGCLSITVRDEGIGLPEDFDPAASKGVGLSVVNSIVQQLGATMHVESKGGAQFTVNLPAG